jgi:myosin heavy subunit
MGKGSLVAMKLDVAQAIDGRDTLSKALYSNLFDWIIKKVNENLSCLVAAPYAIGILDIFGFEVFELNSFEQLCINYSNEKLQLHFNTVVFESEMIMYREEEVSTDKVDYKDNSQCVALIEGKPYGLISLLEEECSLGNATDTSYANKIEATFGKGKKNENSYFVRNKTKPDFFAVHHFAGAVEYNVKNFLDKNRDTLSQSSRDTMSGSSIDLIKSLFELPPSAEGSKKGSKSTLGGQFRNQLVGLVTGLKTQEAHFIRCVKPNMAKKPGIFESPLTLRQLR